jgi:hypothetical protein
MSDSLTHEIDLLRQTVRELHAQVGLLAAELMNARSQGHEYATLLLFERDKVKRLEGALELTEFKLRAEAFKHGHTEGRSTPTKAD